MKWDLAHRADPRCAALADRHYSRQKIGSPQFMPPGGCVVLYAGTPNDGEAVWGTSTPFARYVKHDWAGAWMCSIFRNEGAGHAVRLIRDAVSATRAVAGEPPELGMVTFIDPLAVRSDKVIGRTFLEAGFAFVGYTKRKPVPLHVFQMLPAAMPKPVSPHGHQRTFYLADFTLEIAA
jgi:hypothetical protein